MTFVRVNPLRGFERMSRRMNEFVNEFEKGASVEFGGFNPKIDISEDDKMIYVFVEIPGINKDNIKITINEDNVLTINGEKKNIEESNRVFIRSERCFGNFSRSIVLPENINKTNINAKFENGILEMSLTKVEPPTPKEINIDFK